jgi:hypothetical protein
MLQGTAPVRAGFWKIKTGSMIDYPQEQRLLEILDNGDGAGAIRSAALSHDFENAKMLAATKDDDDVTRQFDLLCVMRTVRRCYELKSSYSTAYWPDRIKVSNTRG